MPGRYTREGDVRPLLLRTDDMFVVSRPGDEIALSFDATALPPLPAGWTRTFLLYGDGFSKEMNLNSASPDELLPLPFHGMTRYPYAVAGGLSVDAGAPRVPRALQHARRAAHAAVARSALVDRCCHARTGGRDQTLTIRSASWTTSGTRPPPARPISPTRSIARAMRGNTDRMLSMIDSAVAGSAPFLPVRLVVFPEFAHAAPVYRDRRRAARASWRCRSPTSTPIGWPRRRASTTSTSRADR